MERETKDGTHYTTGTNFPTYQDMSDMAERHAKVIANYIPDCDACEATKNGGMIDVHLHTCEYAQHLKNLLDDNKRA